MMKTRMRMTQIRGWGDVRCPPHPLHLQKCFVALGYKPGDFPVSEDLSSRIFALPMHPYLKDEEIERICDVLGA